MHQQPESASEPDFALTYSLRVKGLIRDVPKDEAKARAFEHTVAAYRAYHESSDSCLRCRKPIVIGQTWLAVGNGEVTARFDEPCHAQWLTE